MEFNRCPKCGEPYLLGGDKYCSKCGASLKQKISPSDEIMILAKERRPYRALRFMAGFIEYIGWVIIIAGWLWVLFWHTSVNSVYQKIDVPMVDPMASGFVWSVSSYLAIGVGVAGTFFGIITIATGQLYSVFLDIRDDTHTTMRLIRRFGFMMSEENEA